MENNKQLVMAIPDWVKSIKSDKIAGAIVGLLFVWTWNGDKKKIPNLREYVAAKYDDMSESEIEEICNLLVEHKVVE